MENTNLAESNNIDNIANYQVKQRPIKHVIESPLIDKSEDFSFIRYRNEDDENLVKLYLNHKDEWAFNELVNRYSCKIYRLALKFTKNERNADDVLQEVFITLVEKLGTFRNESKFSTWLYSIAKNTCLMYLRSNKKYQDEKQLIEETYDEKETKYSMPAEDWRFIPDQILMQEKRREKIESILMEIPEIYRTVLRLKDMEGHTNLEVGRLLGLSLSAVKSRLRRARLQFKDKLSQYNMVELI
ncbi:MAG: RNA polymerase sigma factor [Thermodesulfobacteriota bacterium]|nr:MAG: RNA polymerase sigma factor [Thermodesulfobacteriota bacterium]